MMKESQRNFDDDVDDVGILSPVLPVLLLPLFGSLYVLWYLSQDIDSHSIIQMGSNHSVSAKLLDCKIAVSNIKLFFNTDRKNPFDMLHKECGRHNRMYVYFLK